MNKVWFESFAKSVASSKETFTRYQCQECGSLQETEGGVPCGEDDYISSCGDCRSVECMKAIEVDEDGKVI
jgi:hypothetical protein